MEIIDIPSYILDEKLDIAKKHLLPKQLEEHGIKKEQIELSDDVIADVIDRYTREPGVRNLERKLADICRGVAQKIVEDAATKVVVTTDELPDYISSRKFYPELAERVTRPRPRARRRRR
jgi:ATP-dependent Lon protease